MNNKNTLNRLILIVLFSALPVMTIIQYIPSHKWTKVAAASFIILCNFIPLIINHILNKYGLSLSFWFDLCCLPFLYGTLYLGPIQKFYERFDWWDMLLHASAGVLFAALGFYIINLLNLKGVINTYKSTLFEALTGFNLSISISCLWELYEYVSDLLFKTNLMYFDLVDTMSDLLLGTAGSIIAALVFYLLRKKDRIG